MKIQRKNLIYLFRIMYEEHWLYEPGAARYGCVDCSGAFSYAFQISGSRIAHGSNSIARNYIVGKLLPISKAEPGMAAFKLREWTEDQKNNKWYGQAPGDIYHIGLVDEDPRYVLNAKGTKSGFCRDPIDGKNKWHYVAYVKGVDYTTPVDPGKDDDRMTATVVLPQGATGTTVNIRSKKSTGSSLIGKVKVGTKVTILQDEGDWCKIQSGSMIGYMMSNFLEYDGQPTQSEIDSDEVPDKLTPEEKQKILQALEKLDGGIDLLYEVFGRG
jgi:hypothetical protein